MRKEISLIWDSQHGRIEKYNKKGKHLGEFDADTGTMTKPADPTRKVEPQMSNVKRLITVFEKGDDEFLKDEIELSSPILSELQSLFSVGSDNPMYDCFEITIKEAPYFKDRFNIQLNLEKYIYYLECNLDE